MVKQGAMYSDMQLIDVVYHIVKFVRKLAYGQLLERFSRWNNGDLLNLLVEITPAYLASTSVDGSLSKKDLDEIFLLKDAIY